MFDQIESWVIHLPYLLQARMGNHMLEIALGFSFVIYAFLAIFLGSIWSAAHVGPVTPDKQPFAFWSNILAYAAIGSWLALYL